MPNVTQDLCDERTKGMTSSLERIEGKLDRISLSLHGNGEPGMRLRLDRLEQSERRRGRFLWVVVSCTIAAIVAAIFK